MNKAQRKINTHKPKFDLNVHVRDAKGNIVDEQHYRLTIVNGIKEFERPPGSGYFYDESGSIIRSPKNAIAQAVPSAINQKEVDMSHILAQLEAMKQQNAKLQKQLEASAVVETVEELEEIHMTANDVEVEDVPAIPAKDLDNSEELALIAQATNGKAAKPSFLKG